MSATESESFDTKSCDDLFGIKNDLLISIKEDLARITLKKAMKQLRKKNPEFKNYEKELINELNKQKKIKTDMIPVEDVDDRYVYTKLDDINNNNKPLYKFKNNIFDDQGNCVGVIKDNQNFLFNYKVNFSDKLTY